MLLYVYNRSLFVIFTKDKNIHLSVFNMVSLGGQEKLGPRPDRSPQGFNSKFSSSIPTPFLWAPGNGVAYNYARQSEMFTEFPLKDSFKLLDGSQNSELNSHRKPPRNVLRVSDVILQTNIAFGVTLHF